MKILLVMDPGILVPPVGYGGIERIIEMLAKQYVELGHDVHLLVTTGSFVPGCTMHPFGKVGFPPKRKDAMMAIPTAWAFLWRHRNTFDLIHSFGRLIYLLPVLNQKVKKIMSYQREITKRNIDIFNRFPQKNMAFTGCSNDLIVRSAVTGNWNGIHNACNFNFYTLKPAVLEDAPLIFLGRIERVKGCHTAIAVAKATGHTLIIAGNISPLTDEQEYYKKEVEPLIDSKQILYVGQVNDEEKNKLLGTAKALLMPIEWNEPFGIVMVEAMACGTPVIAFNKGSVAEVVDEGITGYKVDDIIGMNGAVQRVLDIDRSGCRQHARKRFDVQVIAEQYLNVFSS